MLHFINSAYIILPFFLFIIQKLYFMFCMFLCSFCTFCFVFWTYTTTPTYHVPILWCSLFHKAFFLLLISWNYCQKLTKYFQHLTKPLMLWRVVVSCTLNIMSLFRLTTYVASIKHVNINKYLFAISFVLFLAFST